MGTKSFMLDVVCSMIEAWNMHGLLDYFFNEWQLQGGIDTLLGIWVLVFAFIAVHEFYE